MNFLDDPQRELLVSQILSARTLSEVEEALTALHQWRERYPDDWGILDAGEQLSHFHDALLEGYSPFVKPASWTEWQWLEYQVIGARTLPDIQDARYALKQWTEHHPGEVEPDKLEMLFLLLNVVEETHANEKAEPMEKRELAGQRV